MMMLLGEGLILLSFAGAAMAPLFWGALFAMTLSADKRSRAAAEGSLGGNEASQVTRFARPAKVAALSSVALGLLYSATWIVPLAFRSDVPLSDVYAYFTFGLLGLSLIVAVVLPALLVAAAWDMHRRRRTAGRDLKIAYGVVGAMWAVQVGAFLVLAVSGVQML